MYREIRHSCHNAESMPIVQALKEARFFRFSENIKSFILPYLLLFAVFSNLSAFVCSQLRASRINLFSGIKTIASRS